MQADAPIECRAFGVVPNRLVGQLATTMRGMCSHYAQIDITEVVLKAPVTDTSSTQLRLTRATNQTPERWMVTHEGLPRTGAAAQALPAAVREITESLCCTPRAPEFWMGLGAQQEYVMQKRGNEYTVPYEGFDLQVTVYRPTTTPGAPGAQSRPFTAGQYVVDVRVRVADGLHAPACQAIGSFARLMRPLVELKPAMLPR